VISQEEFLNLSHETYLKCSDKNYFVELTSIIIKDLRDTKRYGVKITEEDIIGYEIQI